MPNTLEAYILARGLDETEAMNALQNHGIISDNCERASDCGNSGKAVSWLEEHKELAPRRRFSLK